MLTLLVEGTLAMVAVMAVGLTVQGPGRDPPEEYEIAVAVALAARYGRGCARGIPSTTTVPAGSVLI
jgi:hypothetical protein